MLGVGALDNLADRRACTEDEEQLVAAVMVADSTDMPKVEAKAKIMRACSCLCLFLNSR